MHKWLSYSLSDSVSVLSLFPRSVCVETVLSDMGQRSTKKMYVFVKIDGI